MAGSFRRKQKGLAPARPERHSSSAGQVRIIAGRWRGRKLPVPDIEGLRPTGNRLRETLFNWLRDRVAGAQCLDLFAGSGALGFEALSRYAQSVTFVEPDPVACRNLLQTCNLLDVSVVKAIADSAGSGGESPTARLIPGTAERAIEHWSQLDKAPCYDLVFIDPPFQMACQWDVLDTLAALHLADDAQIYIESPSAQSPPERLPPGCDFVREKRVGEVTARLLRYSRSS